MDKKNLLKGTLVYTLSNIIIKAGSIIFLPILTRILTVEEYGVIGSLGTITSFFTIILGLGLYNAQVKKCVVLKDNEKELGSYLSSTNFFLLFLNVLVVLFLFTPVSKNIFGGISGINKIDYNPLIIIAVVIAIVNVFNNMAVTFFRTYKKYFLVASGSIISFFLNYLLAIYFISKLKLGALGYVSANLAAVIILFLFYSKSYLGKFGLPLKGEYVKYSLVNGIPLIFIELTDQVVNLSDRIILLRFLDFKVVGYYTLAYTAGKILSVVTNSFISTWIPEFYEIMNRDPEDKSAVKVLVQFAGILTIVSVLAQIFCPEVIHLIFPAKFYNAIIFIPVILPVVVIQLFNCLDYFFHFHNESKYIIIFSFFSMVFNLVFNILYIPKYGALVAAWTTLLAFLLRAVMEMIVIKKRYNITFEYRKLFLYLFLMLNPVIFYLGSGELGMWKFLLKILYMLVVLKLIVNKDIYKKILSIFKKFMRKTG